MFFDVSVHFLSSKPNCLLFWRFLKPNVGISLQKLSMKTIHLDLLVFCNFYEWVFKVCNICAFTFEAYGYYIYLEVSGATPNASARFISGSIPATTATGGKCLRFWYHMYGPHVNALNVYVKVGSHVGAAVWNRNGTRGDKWHLGSVTVRSPYFFNVGYSY